MKLLTQLFLILLLLLSERALLAQSNSTSEFAAKHKAFKKGEKLFKNGNFVEAEEQFQILLDSGYRDNELITLMAQVHLELHEPHSAKNTILFSEKRNQDLDYLLAISHYYLEEFDEAYKELSLVTDTATYHVDHMHKQIENSVNHYHDAQGYVIQNFGPEVNTKFREYAAVMYDDFNELLFTTRNDSSEYTAHDGFAFETIHDTSIDSLNDWHVADPFEFHTGHEKKHDATVQVYQHGKKLVTFHDGRLYKSHLVEGTWEEDGPLDIHGFDGIDTHCYLADDESFVIFSSDFHSYGHNLDLYVSYRQDDGSWSEPEDMVDLNTELDEDAPFLSADSTLYFSSRGHGALGGYDVFKSTYDKDKKKWSEPVNLDYPINTVSEDIYYTTYGKIGYISSTRVGGYGSLDLYRILLFNKVKIQGRVIDEKTKEPIPNAQIDLEYDSLYFRSYTDIEGKYEMFVPVNKDMKVTFIKDSLNLHEGDYFVDIFFRDKENREFNFLIPNDSADPNAITKAEVIGGSKLIHIDLVNDFEENPAIASIANDKVSHWSDSLNNHYEQVRIANYQPGPGIVTVFFDYNSYDLGVSGREEIAELYTDILDGRDFTVEISGHTDNRGSHSYNEKLSLHRARAVKDFLSTKGLKNDKVIVHGHGETKLKDETDTEESHTKNRRVEINFY